jgi:hypothetical protein
LGGTVSGGREQVLLVFGEQEVILDDGAKLVERSD